MTVSWDHQLASPQVNPKVQRAAAPTPSRPLLTNHSADLITEAFAELEAELDRIIDRHFAARRTIRLERESVKHFVAVIDTDTVLYRSPDHAAVVRFIHAFARKTPGVVARTTAPIAYLRPV